MTRLPVYAFCSVRGGVGKSTLASVAAALLGAKGRTAVLDLDFTGTSLADGLGLSPPDLDPLEDGRLDMVQASGRPPLPPDRVYALWRKRAGEDAPWGRHLPYLNDALVPKHAGPTHLATIAWSKPGHPGVAWFPSSPTPRDVEAGVGWLYSESNREAWQARFRELLGRLPQDLPGLAYVVLDLPTGLWGFAHYALRTLAGNNGPADAWRPHPYLVFTPDTNDRRQALDRYPRAYRILPEMRLLLNRNTMSLTEVQRLIQVENQDDFGMAGLERMVLEVGEHPSTLGRVFLGGDIDVGDALRANLEGILRIGGGHV
jgi:hypothetical protein